MDQSAYETLVRGLCTATGVQGWQQVAGSRHISVDGHVVGLIPDDGDSASDTLTVYIELESEAPARSKAFLAELLSVNVERMEGGLGYFGLHPDSGRAVYCVEVDRAGLLEGQALAELLRSQVTVSAAALRSIEQQLQDDRRPR